MTDWTQLVHGRERIRYRERETYGEGSGWRFELQVERGGEWRPVRNWTSRDWFALGFRAGQVAGQQEELKL